jgi:hypothetical protein
LDKEVDKEVMVLSAVYFFLLTCFLDKERGEQRGHGCFGFVWDVTRSVTRSVCHDHMLKESGSS